MHLERQTTHGKTNGHITKQEIQMAYKHVTMCSTLLGIRIYKLKSQPSQTGQIGQKFLNLIKPCVVKTVV